jgi:undecaprenyl-diphosphatase
MDWFTALLIGMIQGLLEWLPVSSSGQTTIVMVNFLGIRPEAAISFGLAVHIGTAFAVFARYPKPLLDMLDLRTPTGTKRFYWITTIISLAVALPVLWALESTFDSNLWTGLSVTVLVGLGLVITGLALRRVRRSSLRRVSGGSVADYLLVGLGQAFAVLPGVSRSGLTMAALLGRKFRKVEALTFSFLLSVPVSAAAFAYMLVFEKIEGIPLWLLAVAALSSFVFGYLSIRALVGLARGVRFSKFCIFLGGITVAIALSLWWIG